MDRYQTEILSPALDASDVPSAHVSLIGRFRSRGGFAWEQVASNVALHCIRAGRGTFTDDGVPFIASAGDVFVFLPGHHYRYSDEADTPWRYDYAIMTGAGAERLARRLTTGGPLLRLGTRHLFWIYLDEAVQAYRRPSLSVPQACRLSWQLFEALDDLTAAHASGDVGARVRDYLEYLDTDYPSVDQLAHRFGVDRTTLFRRFRATTGVSVKHWLDAARFRRAQDLLAISDAPIHEISRLCGFKDADYFSRAFRRRNGVAPGQWRKQNGERRATASAAGRR